MFRLLRHYNKWLLAIFGSLLMVIFLVPGAINRMSQRAGQGRAVWAVVDDGTEIKADVRADANADLEVLERLGLPVGPYGVLKDPTHWFLLVREAEAAGLVGPRGSDELPPDQAQVLFAAVGQNQVTERALARWFGVQRLVSLYRTAAKFSDTRIRTEARELLHGVESRYVVLAAKPDESLPEPTAEAIAAQFDEFKDVVPGTGERGFGYRLPNRFKLELLEVPGAAIRALAEAEADRDPVALVMHWKRNPGKNVQFPPFETGARIPDAVRNDYVDRVAATKRADIAKVIDTRLLEARRGMTTTPEGWFDLPADWSSRRPGLAALADAVREAMPDLALPTYQAWGDRWRSAADLPEIAALVGATTDAYGSAASPNGRVAAGTIIAAAREFAPESALILFQAQIASPVLEKTDGTLVVFRLTDVDPARAPAGVDEVRDAVVRDLRRIADYDRLVAREPELLASARSEGLLAVAMREEAEVSRLQPVSLYNAQLLALQMQFQQQLGPVLSTLTGLGQHEPTLRAIVDRALAHAAVADLTTLPPEDRIFSVEAPDKLAVTLVELFRQQPIDQETYRALVRTPVVQSIIASRELDKLDEAERVDPFALEALTARHNFRLAGAEG